MITATSNQVPMTEGNFGLKLNHYVSGRINAAVVEHGGISRIAYNGKQCHEKNLFFSASDISCFDKLARVQVLLDDVPYYLEFHRTQHFPFGYRSECILEDIKLQHELILDQNALLQRVTVLSNPSQRAVRARLLIHGHLNAGLPGRQWTPWTIDKMGRLSCTATDDDDGSPAETNIIIGANQPLKSDSRHGTFKSYMETTCSADETIFYLAFNTTDDIGPESAQRMNSRLQSYTKALSHGLRFDTGNPLVDSALTNAVPTILSLALPDRPGAIRGCEHYWVWGWDSMVHAEALLWSGHSEVVRNMLDFYRDTADPQQGVAHAMDYQFAFRLPMAPSAQCLYTVMLYNYYAATGDEATLERHLPFAKKLVKMAGSASSMHSALSTGIGFFPDFPQLLEHQPNDVSLINNSLYLQALRALQELCGGYEDLCATVQADMEEKLWDAEAGYWVDSVGEADQKQRKYHPLYGQLYVSPFGTTPKTEETDTISQFLREQFHFSHGLYMYPATKPGFMADGNQLGAYYPPVDRYYWNMMNRSQCREALLDFERIVSYFWAHHNYPEGLTHETANVDPTIDCPGGKQAFTAKAWCCDAIELNLGLRVFTSGFSLNPMRCEKPFRIYNLMLRGKRINFERHGAGASVSVRLNNEVVSPDLITWSLLAETNWIEIRLT